MLSQDIGSGVKMPLVNLGAGSEAVAYASYTSWIHLGGRGFDTAFDYGRKQYILGQVLRESSLSRSSFFITTKIPCCPTDWINPFCKNTFHGSPNVSQLIQDDLNALHLDSVDLLLMHWPCSLLSRTLNTYAQMEDAFRARKTASLGVSNFNSSILDAVVRVVKVPPAINQCGFSIINHEKPRWGRDAATFAKTTDLGVTYQAYTPLGKFISGESVISNDLVARIAQKHNKSAAQIAFRWLVQQGIIVVMFASSELHQRQALDVFSFELEADDMLTLSSIDASPSAWIASSRSAHFWNLALVMTASTALFLIKRGKMRILM